MKTILGIVPSAQEITMQIVKGDKSSQTCTALEKEVFKYPDKDQTEKIVAVNTVIKTVLTENSIDEVCILKAGASPTGKGASPDRIKAEAAIQLAAADKGLPVSLIAPQTLTAAKKKSKANGDPSIDDKLNHNFTSETKRDAAILASTQIAKGK